VLFGLGISSGLLFIENPPAEFVGGSGIGGWKRIARVRFFSGGVLFESTERLQNRTHRRSPIEESIVLFGSSAADGVGNE
jgi:hypothetical protein